MDLSDLGWMPYFEALFEPHRDNGLSPGRISKQHRGRHWILTESGEVTAEVSGRFRHGAASPADYPAVGDWVALQHTDSSSGLIHAVLPRRGAITRKVAGETTEEQVLAANVDTAFLVTGLDNNYNLRRIERYLTTAWDGGALPVIVLNKSDLADDPVAVVDEVQAVAVGAPVLAVSALANDGIELLTEYLKPGTTAVFLGSSGVGKSTIINRLLREDRMKTGVVRQGDSRGRHTTTHRELLLLPGGGLLIDTPGMRELQLWADEDSLRRSFDDIDHLAESCRFSDCRHEQEPGCAVVAAVESGDLSTKRYESFLKQRKELENLERRKDVAAQRQYTRQWAKRMRTYHKERRKVSRMARDGR